MALKPKKIEEPATYPTSAPKKEEPKYVFIVKQERPKQEITQAELEDGSTGIILNFEEALTEILNVVKRLEKGLL